MVKSGKRTCLHFSLIEVFGHEMDPSGGDGINVVALDQRDHSVLLSKSYDTTSVTNASGDLVRDLRGVRRGSLIIASAKGEITKMIDNNARGYFHKMGSQNILNLAPGEGWAFIGVKGQSNGVEKKEKKVEIGVTLGYARRVKRTRTREEIAAGSSIEIYSAGSAAGGKNSYAEIKLNGDYVFSRDSSKDGLNVVVLNGPDHKILHQETYNFL